MDSEGQAIQTGLEERSLRLVRTSDGQKDAEPFQWQEDALRPDWAVGFYELCATAFQTSEPYRVLDPMNDGIEKIIDWARGPEGDAWAEARAKRVD